MAATDPQVSVVLPTRDRLELLPRAIDSVLGQAGVDLECIVVDDGSTDGTGRWLDEHPDPRVVVVATDGDAGPSGARNRGIAVARGRYVAFQDSDDEWLPGKLEAQLAALAAAPGAAVCFTGMVRDVEGSRVVEVADLGDEPFDALLAWAGPITTPGLVVDRDIAGAELRFDEAMPAMVEHELLLRLARRFGVVRVPDPLYVRHQHAGPRVTDPRRQIAGRERLLDLYARELADRPRAAAVHHWRLAVARRRTGDLAGAAADVARAAALDPKLRFRALAVSARAGRRGLQIAWAVLDALDACDPRRRISLPR